MFSGFQKCIAAAKAKPFSHKFECVGHSLYFFLITMEGKEFAVAWMAVGLSGVAGVMAVYTIVSLFIPETVEA